MKINYYKYCRVKRNKVQTVQTPNISLLAGFQAPAQADGLGFVKLEAGPKAVSGQAQGPAWPGIFWPGLARLLASGRSRQITTSFFQVLSLSLVL